LQRVGWCAVVAHGEVSLLYLIVKKKRVRQIPGNPNYNTMQDSILLVFRNSKEPLRMLVGYYMLYTVHSARRSLKITLSI